MLGLQAKFCQGQDLPIFDKLMWDSQEYLVINQLLAIILQIAKYWLASFWHQTKHAHKSKKKEPPSKPKCQMSNVLSLEKIP